MKSPLLFLSTNTPGDAACLSPSELQRYESIKAPLRRSQFLGAHSLLHLALNFYSGQERHPYNVLAPAGQAPRIEGGPYLSLSHSAGLAACLISPQGPCGLDVEDASVQRDYAALAAHSFEGEALKNASNSQGFYEAWCLKETRTKAGLQGPQALFHYEGFQGALQCPQPQVEALALQSGALKKISLKIDWL